MAKKTYRRLRQGDRIPETKPLIYKTSDGYICYRWTVSDTEYVEALEHRIVAGIVDGRHVHHINRNRSDNSPENLEIVTSPEHHRRHRRINDDEVAALYLRGLTQPQIAQRLGVNSGSVSRSLARRGVRVISGERQAAPVDHDEILRLHRKGVRTRRIADMLGISTSPVKRTLRLYGESPHPTGRPSKRPSKP